MPVLRQWAAANKTAAARAGLATALAYAVGLAAGHPAYGALAAMGALNGVTSDAQTGYRTRLAGIVLPQCCCVAGLVVGSVVYGGGWLTVAVVTLVALLSGIISSLGRIASASGLLLLLNTVVAAGLPLPGPWWLPPLLMTLGTLLFLILALIAWPLRPWGPERDAVANVYRAVTEVLASCSDDAQASYEETRRALTQALNQAYDLLLAHRPSRHDSADERAFLIARLDALVPLIEAAPLARLNGRPLPAHISAALHDLAASVQSGRLTNGWRQPPDVRSGADQAVVEGLRHAAGVVAATQEDMRVETDGFAGAHRIRHGDGNARFPAISAASWRYGVRLALCIGLAQAVISLVPVPRSYWVPLTVTFVLKPDFGSVFSRAVLRVLGTVPGLAVAAAVLAATPKGWWEVLVVFALAALVPALTPRGYAHQTAAITPLILLLSDMLSHQGEAVLLPRLVDSAIGCAITLVAGYLLWPESWHTRVGARLADTVEDCARYLESSFAAARPVHLGHLRRCLYRDLSAVRMEFQQALSEPPPTGRTAAAWWPVVAVVERIVDVTTAVRTHVAHGGPPPPAAEVAWLGQRIRLLADLLRGACEPSAPVERPRPEVLSAAAAPVLQPLYQAVAALDDVVTHRLAQPASVAAGTRQREGRVCAVRVRPAPAGCRACGTTRWSSDPRPAPSCAPPRSR